VGGGGGGGGPAAAAGRRRRRAGGGGGPAAAAAAVVSLDEEEIINFSCRKCVRMKVHHEKVCAQYCQRTRVSVTAQVTAHELTAGGPRLRVGESSVLRLAMSTASSGTPTASDSERDGPMTRTKHGLRVTVTPVTVSLSRRT
jgi:hypothetical protein